MTLVHLPLDGDWPCQTEPVPVSEALVRFLYLALRDGANTTGDIEELAIRSKQGGTDDVKYTNPHLEAYARSLATYLCS